MVSLSSLPPRTTSATLAPDQAPSLRTSKMPVKRRVPSGLALKSQQDSNDALHKTLVPDGSIQHKPRTAGRHCADGVKAADHLKTGRLPRITQGRPAWELEPLKEPSPAQCCSLHRGEAGGARIPAPALGGRWRRGSSSRKGSKDRGGPRGRARGRSGACTSPSSADPARSGFVEETFRPSSRVRVGSAGRGPTSRGRRREARGLPSRGAGPPARANPRPRAGSAAPDWAAPARRRGGANVVASG